MSKSTKGDEKAMMVELGKGYDCSVSLMRYRTGHGWVVEVSEGGTRYRGRTAKSALGKALKVLRAKY